MPNSLYVRLRHLARLSLAEAPQSGPGCSDQLLQKIQVLRGRSPIFARGNSRRAQTQRREEQKQRAEQQNQRLEEEQRSGFGARRTTDFKRATQRAATSKRREEEIAEHSGGMMKWRAARPPFAARGRRARHAVDWACSGGPPGASSSGEAGANAGETRLNAAQDRPRTLSTSIGAVAAVVAHELVVSKPALPTDVQARVFSFWKSTVLRLKSSTNSSLPDNTKPFSTFQSLATHAWRSVSHARRLPPEAITVFAVFADCRLRIRPSIPNSYFGNLIQVVFTDTAVEALLTAPP
ncbi:BAHD acyltransferase DCR [Platanthera guangdongensis]|uniref:BAHD acyltransferase DCR n=1 Tax=Platanthera guangdongensis TaxID=2320717 RepID=A0ABR2M105_9ASPA